MEFVKKHKVGVVVGAVVAVAAVVGGVLLFKKHDSDDDSKPKACKKQAVQGGPKRTTGAEGFGNGDANDMDGETSLIAGYDINGKAMKIGDYHTTWGANRSTMLLVVNAPTTLDGKPLGIKVDARSISIPLDGWEDSSLKDLYVDPDQEMSVKLPGGENMCIKISDDLRNGVLNVVLFPSGDNTVYFPAGFVIPAMNLRLITKPVQEQL